MLVNLRTYIIKLYYRTVSSMAFVPLVLMILFGLLAFLLISLHDTTFGNKLIEWIPWLRIDSASRASVIVSTLLAGQISLTVFSFSMVMVVMNQASTQFTPRIITYITKNAGNQSILGFYLGSILYYIILLIFFTKERNEHTVPELAFAFAVIFGIASLMLFVWFIHTISLSIQVSKIIRLIYRKVKTRLEELLEVHEDVVPDLSAFNDVSKWYKLAAPDSGYFQSVMESVTDILKEKNLKLCVHVPPGEFMVKGNIIASVNGEVSPETAAELSNMFVFYSGHNTQIHSHYGFTQLTEIASKALSEAINDPGTAKMCIDFLSDLLWLRSRLTDVDYVRDDAGEIRVVIQPHTFANLLRKTLTPLRFYGRFEVQILIRLVKCIFRLAQNDLQEKQFVNLYNENLLAIIFEADNNLKNPSERQYFNEHLALLNSLQGYFNFKPLA